MGLPDWYLTAGCLFQRVWNHLHGYPLANGILDYDLFYCDPADLSWEAENKVIERAADAFDNLGVEVQVRNQARVHVWFEDHFGIAIAPFASSKDAIRNFLATACCIGIRTNNGTIEVYSPFGTDDLFELIVCRNAYAAGPQSAFEKKTKRWTQLWPRLTVLPWDSPR
ncbi:MAG TPA: nucleotidyltransferase family protein [Actinomycetota bacterium]|nr:nucleotidyltransferase family protein [Actinomycetota bacterium]